MARIRRGRHPDASGRPIKRFTPLWQGGCEEGRKNEELLQLTGVEFLVHMVEAFDQRAADEARGARRERWAAALTAAAREGGQSYG